MDSILRNTGKVKLSAIDIEQLPNKKCTRCHRHLDSNNFHKDKNKKDGLYTICKDCRSGKTQAPFVPEGYRMCRLCDEVKPDGQFYPSTHATRQTCMDCSDKRWVKSYRTEPGRFPGHLKQSLLSYLSPSEQRAVLRSNPKARKRDNESDKRYRISTKGQRIRKEWRKNNPEKLKNYQQINRSRMLNLPYDFNDEYWKMTLQEFGYQCVYCGKKSNDLARDHWIPASKGGGYILGNIVPACKSCNSSKRDKLPLDFCGSEKFLNITKILRKLGGSI